MAHTLNSPPPLPQRPFEDPEVDAYLSALFQYVDTLRTRVGQLLPRFLSNTATFNPANLVDGAGETTTVTVTGARLGDLAQASFSLDVQGISVTAYVSADDTVSVRFQNETGGALNLAEGTLRAVTMRLE